MARRPSGRYDLKSRPVKFRRSCGYRCLIFVPHTDKNLAVVRQTHTTTQLCFCEGQAKGDINAHDFSRRFHLRAQQSINAGKFVEWENRFFNRNMLRQHLSPEAEIPEFSTDHHTSGEFG